MVAAGYCLYGEACAVCLILPALDLGWVGGYLCQSMPACTSYAADNVLHSMSSAKPQIYLGKLPAAGSNCAMVLSIGEGCSVFTLDPSLGEFVLTEPAVRPPARFQTHAYRQAKRPCKWAFQEGQPLLQD